MDPAAVAAERERQAESERKTKRIMFPLLGGIAALGMVKLGYDWMSTLRTRRKRDPEKPWEL